jgi:hypothetical protein
MNYDKRKGGNGRQRKILQSWWWLRYIKHSLIVNVVNSCLPWSGFDYFIDIR